MKSGPYSFSASIHTFRAVAISALGISCAAASPIGINFHGLGGRSGTKKGTIDTEETAFGVAGNNWANILLSAEGNPAFSVNESFTTVTLGGNALGVSWNTGSMFNPVTRDSDAAGEPEARVLNYYARNLGANGETGASITISGLSAYASGYKVRIVGANRDGGVLGDINVSGGEQSQSLSFSSISGITFQAASYPNAVAGITSSSQTFNSDSLTIQTEPDGNGIVSGISAVIIEPVTAINAFNDESELQNWELITAGRASEEDDLTGYEGSSISYSTGLEPEYRESLQITPHADGLWSTDVDQNTDSGSLKVTARNNGASTNISFAIVRHFEPSLDISTFEKLEFDVLFSPTSSRRRFGNYGVMKVELLHPGGAVTLKALNEAGGETNTSAGVPGSEGAVEDYKNQWNWQKISSELTPEAQDILGAVTGIRITTSLNYEPLAADVYFDNFQFIATDNPIATNSDPQLSITKANQGLLLTLDSATPGQPLGVAEYQNIRTLPGDYTWIDRATPENPVTYSFTIGAYPGKSNAGTSQFESHIFIVPQSDEHAPSHNPHITHPHALRLTLNGDNSSAWAHLAYKIDYPDGDGYWTADEGIGGQLGSVSRPSVLGTWSLQFTSNSAVRLIAPNGASQSWNINIPDYTGVEGAPPTVEQAFAGPISVYFGSGVRDGQGLHHLEARDSSWFTEVSITGVPSPVTETFSAAINENIWDLSASINPASIKQLAASPDSSFWLSWNRSATGYSLQESPNLENGSWSPSETSIQGIDGERNIILKTHSKLPSEAKGFFRLVKP